MAWAAYYILSRQSYDSIDPNAHCQELDKYALKDITFQQVIDEFNNNKAMLQDLFRSIEHTGVQKNYDQIMEKTTNNLKILKTLLTYHLATLNIKILHYKKVAGTNAITDAIAKAILDSSSPLIELNILHKTITSYHHALAIIAGYHHTSKVTSMLLDAHARSIYSAGSPLSPTPITAHELTTALTTQPHSRLVKYGPLSIACCLITAASYYCYYWMNTVNPTT